MSEDYVMEKNREDLLDLAAMAAEELHPDLVDWVEEGAWGQILRHPLVYMIPLSLPGYANKSYLHKKAALKEAIEEEDWRTVVWLHERAYRLQALIDYVTGRYFDTGGVVPATEHFDLIADVWVDSENIFQVAEDWRALLLNFTEENQTAPFLGTAEERAEFDALPDPIVAYRGGSVGDWSWTTSVETARFFSNRSGLPVRTALIPKADCFGYLTRRGESELLVRLTPERQSLVYPEGEPDA